MALANGGTSPLGPWFVAGPVIGGPDKDTVLHATTTAQAEHYASLGYSGFATQAEAEAFAGGVNANQQQIQQLNQNPLGGIPGLSQIGGFFGALTSANTWIRVAKVVIGGALLIIGIAHITGASNAVADAARKVPLPV